MILMLDLRRFKYLFNFPRSNFIHVTNDSLKPNNPTLFMIFFAAQGREKKKSTKSRNVIIRKLDLITLMLVN